MPVPTNLVPPAGPTGQGPSAYMKRSAAKSQAEAEALAAHTKQLADARKDVELELVAVQKEETYSQRGLTETNSAARALSEQVETLQNRLSDVSAELEGYKTNDRLTMQYAEALEADDFNEHAKREMEVTSFRSLRNTVRTAFTKVLKAKLRDPEWQRSVVAERGIQSKPEYCQVIYGDSSADWKVLDARDGTDSTFGAMLQEAARYFGADHTELVCADKDGTVWPLEAHVFDELGVYGSMQVWLVRRPGTSALGGSFDCLYEMDEDELPLHERRRLYRVRKQALLLRETKEQIRRKKAQARSELYRELVKYLCMMLLYFYVLIFGRRSPRDAFMLTDSVREAFVGENFGDYNEKTYLDIRTYEEFYMWARDVFTPALLPSEYYEGTAIPEEKKRVTYYNRIVGGVRMRQQRVTPNAGCTIKGNVITNFFPTKGPDEGIERVRKYVTQCFSEYRAAGVGFDTDANSDLRATWSRRPYSVLKQTFTNETGPAECRALANTDYSDARIVTGDRRYDSYEICLGRANYRQWEVPDPETGETNMTDALKLAFTWRPAAANSLSGYSYQGRYAAYDGSGFVYDLVNLTTSNLVEAFNYLESNTWLDRSTRALYISLVMYNANLNLYGIVNFDLELSRAGLFIPKYSIVTAEMDLFRSWRDSQWKTFSMILEAVLYFGMVCYLFNEFREVYSIYDATGTAVGYFKDFWNLIDWSLIVLSFLALIQRIMFALSDAVTYFDPFAREYQEVTGQAKQYNDSFAFDAIAATFGIIKIFRYFELQRNLLILRSSIERGIGDLSSFTVILMIMILGFSFAGMNIFGQEFDDFVDAQKSFLALFMTVLGEFDLDRMLAVSQVWAYFYFMFYQLFVFLIMVNIFLAILNDSYLAIKEIFNADEIEEVEAPPTLHERLRTTMTWLRQRQLDRRIEHLRKQQRVQQLAQQREENRKEEMRAKLLRAMGADVTTLDREIERKQKEAQTHLRQGVEHES